MSDRPPQTLKDLVERVPDGEARLALQALLREVERLQGEVADRDRALETVRKYLQKAFSMTFDGWCAAFESSNSGLSARTAATSGAGAAPVAASGVKSEHEEDRDALAQAEAEGDYLEFCRRAFRILEGEVFSFVEEARAAVPAAAEAVWGVLQQKRVDRSNWAKEKAQKEGKDVSDWNDYKPQPLQDDIKRNSISDLVEFVFILLYGNDYLKASRWQPTPSYDRYWTLTRVREVRNAASHSRGGKMSFRNSDTRSFFEAGNFNVVRAALAEVEADFAEQRTLWAKATAGTDGEVTD